VLLIAEVKPANDLLPVLQNIDVQQIFFSLDLADSPPIVQWLQVNETVIGNHMCLNTVHLHRPFLHSHPTSLQFGKIFTSSGSSKNRRGHGVPHPTILMPPTMTCISKSYLETPRRSSSCVWYLFGQLRIRGLEHWTSWGCDGMSFVPSLHYVDIGQMAGHSANRCWISSRIRAEPASYTRPGKNSLSLLPCAASPVSDKPSWMLMGSCLTGMSVLPI
jgi:hypothetical protein